MKNINFLPDTRQQIILAAFTAAGPGADDAAIAAQVERIADAMLPGSAMSRTLDEIEHYWQETVVEINKPFVATLLYVDMETTSQRPVLALRSEPNSKNPEGKFELIKLGMARGRNRARVIEQAKSYMQMIGHQVTVTRMNEKTGNGLKASVLRSAVANGPNPAFSELHIAADDTPEVVQQKLTLGARLVDWAALGEYDRKIASKLQKLPSRLQRNQSPAPTQTAPAQAAPQGHYAQRPTTAPTQAHPVPAQNAPQRPFAAQMGQSAPVPQFAAQTPSWQR